MEKNQPSEREKRRQNGNFPLASGIFSRWLPLFPAQHRAGERERVEKRGPESQGAQRVIKLNYLAQRERKVLQRCVRPALNNKGIINSYTISHFYACTKIFYGFGLMATILCASLFPPGR
jgi:hypothetical protein